jgi:hypothetical protein
MRDPGRAIGREVAGGERADAELDSFIGRRYGQRQKSEGDRVTEELWREAERHEAARRRAENRAGWYSWHASRAELYARLSAEHAATAEGLLGEGAA